jgi:hypothetical protein
MRVEDMSRIGSKLENLFLERICSSFSKVYSCKRWREDVGGGRAKKPSTDERTRTRGCGQDPSHKG